MRISSRVCLAFRPSFRQLRVVVLTVRFVDQIHLQCVVAAETRLMIVMMTTTTAVIMSIIRIF